jgi:hypothetical protein
MASPAARVLTPPAGVDRDRRLARVQAVSGLVFLLFVSVHLMNTMLAAYSPAAYNGYQRAPAGLHTGVGFWAPVAVGALLSVAGILGMGGWLYPIPDPTSGEVARLAERLLGIHLAAQ